MFYRIAGIFFIAIGLIIFGSVAYHNSIKREQPIVFSERSMLDGIWNYYKSQYTDPTNGRTFDKARDDASTSESESYTMLRAVWWDDKTTFDTSWKWTQSNLQHTTGDSLFSWYYSKDASGNYSVNAIAGGTNTATDGDEDIALSLIFAHDRWGDQSYLTSAQSIISDIWDKEVIVIAGKPYLLANNIEKTSAKQDLIMDPSYLSPASYRIFAQYDKTHDWNGLVNSSYDVLFAVSDSTLDKTTSDGLPPDWVTIDKTTGQLVASTDASLDTNYGYDAMRSPFRIALDWNWNKDERAQQVLAKYTFLSNQWKLNNALYSVYAHDGTIVTKEESPSIYGGDLGYFIVTDPTTATDIYNTKLKALYDPDTNGWKTDLSYYDDNWAWFGMALYNNALVDLDQAAK